MADVRARENSEVDGGDWVKRPKSKISVKQKVEILPVYYAKTYQADDGKILPGRTVFEHCSIVGAVAGKLIQRLCTSMTYSLFPTGADLVASFHDIGKICPTFQKKILQNVTGCRVKLYPVLKNANPALEHLWGGHPGVSQLALEAAGAGKYIPEICGQHHGYTPNVGTYSALAELFGGETWQNEREQLMQTLGSVFNVSQPEIDSPVNARLIAGLVSVADWIGSGELFDKPDTEWEDKVDIALDRAGFVMPEIGHGLSFEDIFGEGIKPYPVQQKFIDSVACPGVYVLEAPMGMGKTEAALYAAYKLLSNGMARGIYFALPTQLTSNRIYHRFNSFLDKIVKGLSLHREALLLHGKAWLEATELGAEGCPGGSWFSSRKRGLLAPFAVGTLDQALMAAMNVRHGFVRAFGLAGKVVILDEIHSYDAYTGTIIDALVSMLRKLQCTVLVLSATLTQSRRSEILGRESLSQAFPLVSGVTEDNKLVEKAVAVQVRQEFSLRMLDDKASAIEQVLDLAASGQYILWIENTVSDAQECYLDLAARASESGILCGLVHSKFLPVHRKIIEDKWVALYGKQGWQRRGEKSRKGCILVGTQVLEQSLDIDADFLVTRFSPTDMLFQRLGRVWRHDNTPRPQEARREAWILAPAPDEALDHPVKSFGSTARVYSPYVLCRSLQVWNSIKKLGLPHDIRSMLEATYSQRKEDGKMAKWLFELENGNRWRQGRKALRQLATLTLATGGVTLPESKAQTRYSEEPLVELLLVRKISISPDDRVSSFILLDGREIKLPWDRWKLNRQQWRSISAEFAGHVISVRYHEAPESLPLDTLKRLRLHYCFYIGSPEHDEAQMRIAVVDESGFLKGYQGARVHEKLELHYDENIGYRTTGS